MLTPAEIAERFVEIGIAKTANRAFKSFLLAVMAGAFIALAAQGSNAAIHTLQSVGLAKALAGALFATGLMMVVITGSELFTGNCLITVSVLAGRVPPLRMLRNWGIVYFGNLVGSLMIALLVIGCGQYNLSDGLLGAFTIKTAVAKVNLSFGGAVASGILCNVLVCMAVWMAAAAKDMSGKLLAIFFPIWLFITSGFEHSVANMYYIPAGILAKTNPVWAGVAADVFHIGPEKLAGLNWGAFALRNLLPVTLGNILGGGLLIGGVFFLAYRKKETT